MKYQEATTEVTSGWILDSMPPMPKLPTDSDVFSYFQYIYHIHDKLEDLVYIHSTKRCLSILEDGTTTDLTDEFTLCRNDLVSNFYRTSRQHLSYHYNNLQRGLKLHIPLSHYRKLLERT